MSVVGVLARQAFAVRTKGSLSLLVRMQMMQTRGEESLESKLRHGPLSMDALRLAATGPARVAAHGFLAESQGSERDPHLDNKH